jgi:hypothetical protein
LLESKNKNHSREFILIKIKKCGDYFITNLSNYYVLCKYNNDYENQILVSTEIWVLEDEMFKLYNNIEQLSLF